MEGSIVCGIAGFCNIEEHWEENIKRMNEAMFHRGPDAGAYTATPDHKVVLGHRRLSIVDLSEAGSQPMTSHSGRFVIVYNGEIYNHRDLRKRLIDEGFVAENEFRGTSDTEVLLEAFEAYGIEKTLQFCKGMWGFALYDVKTQTLFLSRDRVGEKPLYYGFACGGFVFASDIASIEVLEGFHNEVCTDILDVYFEHGYIPQPYSIYEDIYKLPPGTILTIPAPFENFSIKPYWSMIETAVNGQNNLFKGSFQEASEELESRIRAAIKDQMVADVPVGAFLSAGIDSSTTVSLMQDLSGSQKVRSFTIGIEGNDKYNEAVAAKEIAAHLGTEHTELYIRDKDALDVIPLLGKMFREPFADSSQIPTYLVSKMTREHVTVSLSGDGGDELFAGYNTYTSVPKVWNKCRKIPQFVRVPGGYVLEKMNLTNGTRLRGYLLASKSIEDLYMRVVGHSREYEKLTLHGKGFKRVGYTYSELPRGLVKEDIHKIQLMDMLMYHPDDILTKVDRCGMAVSLETRIPLLDRDVVEFAWTLPIEYLRDGETGKTVLRDVLYRYVPKAMMDRPKTGFSIPIKEWLKGPELRPWAEELLNPERIRREGYLNADLVSRYWKEYIERGVWRNQLWYILMFQLWLENKGKRD